MYLYIYIYTFTKVQNHIYLYTYIYVCTNYMLTPDPSKCARPFPVSPFQKVQRFDVIVCSDCLYKSPGCSVSEFRRSAETMSKVQLIC